jgi:hypothetical protein
VVPWQADLSRRLSNRWKTPDQPETPATVALIISTVCILGVVPHQDTMDFGELKSPSRTSLSFPSIIIPDEVKIYEGIDRGKSPPLAFFILFLIHVLYPLCLRHMVDIRLAIFVTKSMSYVSVIVLSRNFARRDGATCQAEIPRPG